MNAAQHLGIAYAELTIASAYNVHPEDDTPERHLLIAVAHATVAIAEHLLFEAEREEVME